MAQLKGGTTIAGYTAWHYGNLRINANGDVVEHLTPVDFTDTSTFNEAIHVANNKFIYGILAAGSPLEIFGIQGNDNVVVGHQTTTMSIRSSNIPRWWNGSNNIDLLHTAGGQTITSDSESALSLQPATAGASVGIRFNSKSNANSDSGWIIWKDDDGVFGSNGTSAENGTFLISACNDITGHASEDALALESKAHIFLRPGAPGSAVPGTAGAWDPNGKVYIGDSAVKYEVIHSGGGQTISGNAFFGGKAISKSTFPVSLWHDTDKTDQVIRACLGDTSFVFQVIADDYTTWSKNLLTMELNSLGLTLTSTKASYGSYDLVTTQGGQTVGGTTTFDTIRLTNTGDASLSSTAHAFQIGSTTSTNLVIDNNEIMARSNGAVSTLNINLDGGTTKFGGNIDVGGSITSGSHIYMGNALMLRGRDTGDTQYFNIAYVGADDHVRIGHSVTPTTIWSSVAPDWTNGTNVYELLHTGGGQTLKGTLTVDMDTDAPAAVLAKSFDYATNLPVLIVAGDGESTDIIADFRSAGTGANVDMSNIAGSTDSKVKIMGNGDVQAVSFTENGTALASKYLGIGAKAADSDKLDNLNSTDFARIGTTSPTTNYLYAQRGSGGAFALYVNRIAAPTEDIAYFFNGSAAGATSGPGVRIKAGGAIDADGSITANGTEALSLFQGGADHVYMGFYADAQATTARSAYLGFASTGATAFTIGNQMNGDFTFITNSNTFVMGSGGDLTVPGDIYASGTKIEGDSKEIIRFSDGWLRLNPANEFASGIFCGTGVLRTDGTFQVGSTSTSSLRALPDGTVTVMGNQVLTVAGGTMTGTLTLKANQYNGYAGVYAMNLNNSDVMGANTIYFADKSDAINEGLAFPRDTGTGVNAYSYIKAYSDMLRFSPDGTSDYNVWHEANLSPVRIIQTANDITTRLDSGFYETSSATTAEGYPNNDSDWYHLMVHTHSNTTNYYSMQLAGDFDQQRWYLRNTAGAGTTGWSQILTSSSSNFQIAGSIGIGTTPAANLGNGKGIALGDNDTGIRQNGDGVLELWRNNVATLILNSSGIGSQVHHYFQSGFTRASDRRLKKNFRRNINPAQLRDKLLKIQWLTFDWKDGRTNDFGVVAQEIKKILPEVVMLNNDGKTWTVDYERIHNYWCVVSAWQERRLQRVEELLGEAN